MHYHPFTRFPVALCVVVVLFAGCSSTTGDIDDAPPKTSTPTNQDLLEANSPVTDNDAAPRSFRDPADDGFAPVDDAVVRPSVDDWLEPYDDGAVGSVDSGSDSVPDRLAMVTSWPNDLIEQAEAALMAVEPGIAVLDSLGPIASGDPGLAGRDGRRRNGAGDALTLDRLALAACGNAEIALALAEDEQDRAIEHLVAASQQIRASGLLDADAWGRHLEDTVLRGSRSELAPLVAFLVVCGAGGYEL